MARWIGERLRDPSPYDGHADEAVSAHARWPRAAWGNGDGVARRAELSAWPIRASYHHLAEFLREEAAPLSERATPGLPSPRPAGPP